jgi:hypothetical protein
MFLHGMLTAAIRGSKPDRTPRRINRVWAGIPDMRAELFGARPLSYRAIPMRRDR